MAVKFFSTIWSALIIAGMFTGLYNPSVKPFTPGEANFPVYEGETMAVIEDGQSGYVIVRGQNAIPAEITAAEKLQGFLEEIGGALLPIVTDDTAPQAKEIVVGDTNRFAVDYALLGEEGFVLKSEGDKIIIAGGKPRGTLYGVFDFLEKFAGCHWYGKDKKVIPALRTVEVPAQIDELEVPAFEYRQFTIVQGGFDVDSALANRANAGWHAAQLLGAPEYGGVSRYVLDGHAGEWIMSEVIDGVRYPMSSPEYFERHSELFAKDSSGSPRGGYTNPCFSRPEVLEIYVDYVRERMAENPDTACISIALNDTNDTCQCIDCKTAYFEECGIPMNTENSNCSGTHFRFLNALCEAVVPDYPDLIINTYAYFNTELAPKTKLHPNALVSFCPIFMCYVHKAGECQQEGTRQTFDVNYKTWVEKCDKFVIYDYPLSYNHWPAVYPVWDNIQSYLRMYRDDGLLGLTNCSSSSQDLAFHQLIGYIYAKLLWNPDMDMEDIYSSFLPDYYGAGWQYVREYIRVVSEELSGRTVGGAQQHTDCLGGGTAGGNLRCTNNEMKYINELWEKAKELTAASSDPRRDAQLRSVRLAELSWRVWKADAFRGEFWFFNIPGTHRKSNSELFHDILDLGIIWHNEDAKYVSAEDFEKLQLDILTPRYWNWRALGRENEGKFDSFWQAVFGILF